MYFPDRGCVRTLHTLYVYATEINSHFSHASFWYVSCKSWTGFVRYQISVPIKTLFYSEPESGALTT